MNIAFDAANGISDGIGGASTYSWSHTCTGNARILIVGFFAYKAADTSDRVTSVTYGGVAMTQLCTDFSAGGGWRAYLYGLVNPASGANNVQIDFNTNMEIGYWSSSYTGAHGSGLPDSTNTGSGSASSVSLSTTTVKDNCWLVMFVKSAPANMIAGTATTKRSGDGSNFGIFDSNAAITPPGSSALAASWASSGNYVAAIASFAPLLEPVGKQFVVRQAAKRASFY